MQWLRAGRASRFSEGEQASPLQYFSLHISECRAPIFLVSRTHAGVGRTPRNLSGPSEFNVVLHVVQAGKQFFCKLRSLFRPKPQRILKQPGRVLRHLWQS